MIMREAFNTQEAFVLVHFIYKLYKDHIPNYTHVASPLVHPMTGEMIARYTHLMNNPETAKVWQMAFGKDLGAWHKETRNLPKRNKFGVCYDMR